MTQADATMIEGVDYSCPMCGYDLRGLPEPRCPECGREFEWADFTDPARMRHRFLFDQQIKNPVRSFLKTWLAGWRPIRFWRGINASGYLSVRRLIVYSIVCSGAGIFLHLSARVWMTTDVRYWHARYLGMGPSPLTKSVASREFWIGFLSPDLWMADGDRIEVGGAIFYASIVLAAIWPWLTVLMFALVRRSMRTAKIRREQLIRVAVYSCDGIALPFMPFGAYFLLRSVMDHAEIGGPWMSLYRKFVREAARQERNLLAMLPLAILLIAMFRLAIAARVYLRMRHAISTVIVTQLILALLIAVVAIWMNGPGIVTFYQEQFVW